MNAYIIMCSTNDNSWNFAEDHDNCQTFLAIRATREGILINGICRTGSSLAFLSILCTSISLPFFFLPFFGVRSTRISMHVCTSSQWHISGSQNITHSSLASTILSLAALIFWKGKRARELDTLCLHRFSTSLLLWYLSVVCTSLFHLSRSSPPFCGSRVFSYFATECSTLKQTSNFESPRTSENTFDHFYVQSRSRNPVPRPFENGRTC